MNSIYQSLIMAADVNTLRPWEYSEWLLTEISELEAQSEWCKSLRCKH